MCVYACMCVLTLLQMTNMEVCGQLLGVDFSFHLAETGSLLFLVLCHIFKASWLCKLLCRSSVSSSCLIIKTIDISDASHYSWLFPSVQGVKLRLPGLHSKHFHPQGWFDSNLKGIQISNPYFYYIWKSNLKISHTIRTILKMQC